MLPSDACDPPGNSWREQVSIRGGGDTEALQLSTTVLIRPLKTDTFTLAFTASTPLLESVRTAPERTAGDTRAVERHSGRRTVLLDRSQDAGVDWMILTHAGPADTYASSMLDGVLSPAAQDQTGRLWRSRVELVYWPADQWTVHAVVSMELSDLKTAPGLRAQIFEQPRIGMAVGVDYRILESLVLDLGYCRYLRADASSNPGSTAKPSAEKDLETIQVFTAGFKIHF